ncbi:MAG: alginate export family protein [Candidatus Omnitrophica bacterium]|nr:alginate export family protein [Candidatus Omnitrophota bacterium]
MSKKIALFCALVGALVLVASPAFAEVQNIKVSGDIQAMAVHRNNYDLEDGRNLISDIAKFPSNYPAEDNDSFLMSIARLRIDADLTDNVAACVRLANVREWDADTFNTAAGGDTANIILDLASITLKEMLYSPLTLIIGRQELMYGNGLIVGYGLYQDPNNSIEYNDLSPLHGYDAVQAILDYDPWTLNLLMAKMNEDDEDALDTVNTGGATDGQDRDTDTDLYGANLGYKFDQYDAEMEGYCFYEVDQNYNLSFRDISNTTLNTYDENKFWTIGLRGSVVPMENLTLGGEIAGQFGEMLDSNAACASGEAKRDREAMLAYASGKYNFADVRFNPVVGLEYLYASGEEVDNVPSAETQDMGDFEAWHPVYRGKVMGTIRDCLETLYTTNDPADTAGFTNQHTIKAKGSLDLGELVDGLSLNLAYLHYWFAEAPSPNADDDVGDEINMTLTYNYTEDVQFLLDGAWFIPGDYYDDVHSYQAMAGGGITAEGVANAVTLRPSNDTAVSIIGSCKVSF